MHLYSLCTVFEEVLWSATKTIISELNFSAFYSYMIWSSQLKSVPTVQISSSLANGYFLIDKLLN